MDTVGIEVEGILHEVDGRLFMDDVAVAEAVQQFLSSYQTFKLIIPMQPPTYPIDEKIAPLVSALQAHGFETLSSCQGHIDLEHIPEGRLPYPYVSYYRGAGNRTILNSFGNDKWEVIRLSRYVARLQTKDKAETEEQLIVLQQEIVKLVKQLEA